MGKWKRQMRQAYDDMSNALNNRFGRPNVFDLSSSERIGAAFLQPTDMGPTDRIMLYALIRGLRPSRVLEIGIRYGGGARIIASALEDNQLGSAVGIDPVPEGFRVPEDHLHGRYQRLTGYSPAATSEAVKLLGGNPDFVFVDAMHTGDAVHADFLGVLPFIDVGGHIAFHDAYHQGVSAAIQEVLDQQTDLIDLGFLSRNPDVRHPVSYQGIRLVRKGSVDYKLLIKSAYEAERLVSPPFDPLLRNYDVYANSVGQGADVEAVNTMLRQSATET